MMPFSPDLKHHRPTPIFGDMADDPYDLARFVRAQAAIYPSALAELRSGSKRGHWMWFVFPQVTGLGRSEAARFYAIASIDEARAYLAHPILGPRLSECVAALQALQTGTAEEVFGAIDAVKLRSSLTLFVAAGAPAYFTDALARWSGGPDLATLARLADQRRV